MIDNIKRFVNEHHTLIVVTISVLIICFLYWCFFYEDRPLVNKVKGGEVGYVFYIDGKYYKCIGMLITDANHPFYVLSLKGEEWFINKIKECFGNDPEKFFGYFLGTVQKLFSAPINLINGNNKNGRTVQQVNSTAADLVNSDSPDIYIINGDGELIETLNDLIFSLCDMHKNEIISEVISLFMSVEKETANLCVLEMLVVFFYYGLIDAESENETLNFCCDEVMRRSDNTLIKTLISFRFSCQN